MDTPDPAAPSPAPTPPRATRAPAIAVIAALVLAAGVGAGWWRHEHAQASDPDAAELHGNVDIRQVALAFDASDRIELLTAREGDRVVAGQLLGRLDSRVAEARLAQAKAQVNVATQALDKLRHGSRPEELAQAHAAVAAAQAQVEQASSQVRRLQAAGDATAGQGISQLELDNARAALHAATARHDEAAATERLVAAGPRKEDVAQAQAQLEAAQANRELLARQLESTELHAPQEGVIRSRLLEPGDLASPQRPVYTLALVQPKWIRAYLAEPLLPRVRVGTPATVSADGLGGDTMRGEVGFVSAVAEFTPKTVETADLRSSLVYEVRVRVEDPQDRLKLGMPATVRLRLSPASAASSASAPR